jgi:hypothetical protein
MQASSPNAIGGFGVVRSAAAITENAAEHGLGDARASPTCHIEMACNKCTCSRNEGLVHWHIMKLSVNARQSACRHSKALDDCYVCESLSTGSGSGGFGCFDRCMRTYQGSGKIKGQPQMSHLSQCTFDHFFFGYLDRAAAARFATHARLRQWP